MSTSALLLHGGPGICDNLAPLADLLPAGCRAVRYDQRREAPFTIEALVAEVEEVRVREDLGRCALIGHSWGANLALLHAMTFPDAVGSIGYLCGTGLEWGRFSALHQAEQRERLGPVLGGRFDELRAITDRSESEQSEYEQLHTFTDMAPGPAGPTLAARMPAWDPVDASLRAALNREVQSLPVEVQIEALSAVTIPVVVVSGEHDPRPIAAVGSVLDALPHAEHHVIPDAGHLPWLEQPDVVAALLARIVALATGVQ